MGLAAAEPHELLRIDTVVRSLERARTETEAVLAALQTEGAEARVVEAVEFTRAEIAAAAKRLRQQALAFDAR